MTFFQSNIQTGILVLLVILVGILCIALFFTNKEVRNIKVGFVKNIHDIEALQNLLDEVGLNNTDSLIDNKNPISSFNNMGGLHPSMFSGMFPPGMEKKFMNIEEGNEDTDDTEDTEDTEDIENTNTVSATVYAIASASITPCCWCCQLPLQLLLLLLREQAFLFCSFRPLQVSDV